MSRYLLHQPFPAPYFAIDIEVNLSVVAKPGTKIFNFQCDSMLSILYAGPSIGFGGEGIEFTATGTIYGQKTTGNVGVEIGFVQSLYTNATVGVYRTGNQDSRFVRKNQARLPVRDSDSDDIWFKSQEGKRKGEGKGKVGNLFKIAPPLATAGSQVRLGLTKDEGFQIKVTDIVKSNFPITFPPKKIVPLTGVNLDREFITCLVARVQWVGRSPYLFYLDHVHWKCNYTGKRLQTGRWDPPPEISPFYTVGPVVPGIPPFAKPDNIVTDGIRANDSETLRAE